MKTGNHQLYRGKNDKRPIFSCANGLFAQAFSSSWFNQNAVRFSQWRTRLSQPKPVASSVPHPLTPGIGLTTNIFPQNLDERSERKSNEESVIRTLWVMIIRSEISASQRKLICSLATGGQISIITMIVREDLMNHNRFTNSRKCIMLTTISLPLFSGLCASLRAATVLAPEEIPTCMV